MVFPISDPIQPPETINVYTLMHLPDTFLQSNSYILSVHALPGNTWHWCWQSYAETHSCNQSINQSWCCSATEQNPEENCRLTVWVKSPCQKASKIAYQVHKELHDRNKLQPHSVDKSETLLPPTAWSPDHNAPYSRRSWSLFLLCKTKWLYIFSLSPENYIRNTILAHCYVADREFWIT